MDRGEDSKTGRNDDPEKKELYKLENLSLSILEYSGEEPMDKSKKKDTCGVEEATSENPDEKIEEEIEEGSIADSESQHSINYSDISEIDETIDPIDNLMYVEGLFEHHRAVVYNVFVARPPEHGCFNPICNVRHYHCWPCENVYCSRMDYKEHMRRCEMTINLACPVCGIYHRFTNICATMKHLALHPDTVYNADHFQVYEFVEMCQDEHLIVHENNTNETIEAERENYDRVLDNDEDRNSIASFAPTIHINISSVFTGRYGQYWDYIRSDW